MKVNVLIFNGYGAPVMSHKLCKLLINEKVSFPLNRIISEERLKEIKQKARDIIDYSRLKSLKEQCQESENKVIRFTDNQFYFYNENSKYIHPFSIVEVDTSRPWKIEEYDGAEYIQYLDYIVINEEINYCDYKK